MRRKDESPALKVAVIGRFRVLNEQGEDLTPKGKKDCGMLAILALTPDYSRPRIALQDKLWSLGDREHGANSLRQALVRIRKKLGPYRDCLETGDGTIALVADRIERDLDTADLASYAAHGSANAPVLLDGLELIEDPEFEDWLRDQRLIFEESIAKAASAELTNHPSEAIPRNTHGIIVSAPRTWVRIVQPTSTTSESGLFYSKVISEAIARGIREVGAADISTTVRDSPGIDLQVDVLTKEMEIAVHVSLREAHDQNLLWSGTQQVPRDDEFICNVTTLQMLINQATDIALFQLRRFYPSHDDTGAIKLGFDALQKMFQGDRAELDVADSLLSLAFEQNSSGAMLAWKAYLRTFLTGEHGIDREAQAEEARMLVREAIQNTPHNSHVLALASYVHSFILGEHEVGLMLAEDSLRLNPANALGLAFLGRAKSYLGQTDEGYRLTSQALAVTGPGPHRYTLYFLCGVSAALSGHFKEAIQMHEMSRTLEPNYRAPLRYLLALYLNEGNRDKARRVFTELRKLEPDFSIRMMRETSYPSGGLRASGLLNFVDNEFD